MERLASILGMRRRDVRRLVLGMVVLFAIAATGTAGFMVLAHLTAIDAFYMTLITVSTVGFGEIGDVSHETRLFTAVLIMAALVWGAWALQAVLGIVLSSDFRHAVNQIRTTRKTRRMHRHTILCGFGRIGRAVAQEIRRNGESLVIIDGNLELVEHLREEGFEVVHGDATVDETLLDAGVKTARRLLSVLNSDNANIVTVLSARQLNPALWIASRVVRPEAERKLRQAGADEVVSPYDFGGRRLALTALRPRVSEFLSEVVFDEGRGAEMDEIDVDLESNLAGRTLAELNLRRRFGVSVISVWHPESGFELNPGPDAIVHAGDALIVVGTAEQLQHVHRALHA